MNSPLHTAFRKQIKTRLPNPVFDLKFCTAVNMCIVSNEGNLWLPARITMTYPFPVIIVVNILVETLLIAFQYYLFSLKELSVVALASSSTSSLLFEINFGSLQCGRRGV
jgi:hypothetical protein